MQNFGFYLGSAWYIIFTSAYVVKFILGIFWSICYLALGIFWANTWHIGAELLWQSCTRLSHWANESTPFFRAVGGIFGDTEWETATASEFAMKSGHSPTRFGHFGTARTSRLSTRSGHSPTRSGHFGPARAIRPRRPKPTPRRRAPGPLPPTGAELEMTEALRSDPLSGSAGHPAALLHLLLLLHPIWTLRFKVNYPIFETPLLLDRIEKLLN